MVYCNLSKSSDRTAANRETEGGSAVHYVALCDDNSCDLELLGSYLKELRTQSINVGIVPFSCGRKLLRAYQGGERFNLVVLDMRMDNISGLDTAREIRKLDSEVPMLFVTATAEYALEGYTVQAYRYLLKPVDKEDFLHSVAHLLRPREAPTRYFTFNCSSGLVKVPNDSILYFESFKRTVVLHTVKGEYSFTGRIGEIADRMEAQGFVRIHKSYVANLHHVECVYKETVRLDDGSAIPLGRQYGKAAQAAVLRHGLDSL